jgi:hypothetical protein
LEWINFKDIINKAKEIFNDNSFIIYNLEGNFVIKSPWAKILCKEKGIKWWWKDDFIQWRDINIINFIDNN